MAKRAYESPALREVCPRAVPTGFQVARSYPSDGAARCDSADDEAGDRRAYDAWRCRNPVMPPHDDPTCPGLISKGRHLCVGCPACEWINGEPL